MPSTSATTTKRWPASLWLGAGAILAAEVLLALDVSSRGAAVLPAAEGQAVAQPQGLLGDIARWVAIDMTPLCWAAYLLLFDGLLEGLRRRGRIGPGSPVRRRPRRFAYCFATSVGVWLFFDWVNFFFIHAWDYHGLGQVGLAHELVAKFVAFAAISPAMFLAAELFAQLGLHRLRWRPVRLGPPLQVAMVVAGVPALLFPFIVQRPVGTLTLWVCLVLVLDPINHRLGAPSLIGDWRAGRYGRTVALLAGGLLCGFLWEFWNYWAAAKWTYDLPFLGALEHVRLFEMPLSGFAGFPPFALECWVTFQALLLPLRRLGSRAVEPLPDHAAIL